MSTTQSLLINDIILSLQKIWYSHLYFVVCIVAVEFYFIILHVLYKLFMMLIYFFFTHLHLLVKSSQNNSQSVVTKG